jgi:haloalkane dehalogenase
VHGYPESSYMWCAALPAVAEAGWRGVAPDLAGFGDSAPADEGTWDEHVERLGRLHDSLDLGRVVLVVHDWGGLIGLRWACDHPEHVTALVISDTGFFSDGKWHGIAEVMRTPGEGESMMEQFTREGFDAVMRQSSPGIGDDALAAYWKAFADERRRAAQLALYRSGNFAELEQYEGKLAELGVPTLLLWGENDEFAPLASAHRFEEDLPDAKLCVVEGAGHFIWDEKPERTAAELARFLSDVRSATA